MKTWLKLSSSANQQKFDFGFKISELSNPLLDYCQNFSNKLSKEEIIRIAANIQRKGFFFELNSHVSDARFPMPLFGYDSKFTFKEVLISTQRRF